MPFEATPLNILLLVLVAAAIWAVAELALTMRKARSAVDTLVHTANDTVEQVQPIIGKVDGVMDDLQPSINEVQPLLERLGTTLESANTSLSSVNGILGDVSNVSGAAASVSDTVKSAASGVGAGVATAVNKLTGRSQVQRVQIEAQAQSAAPEPFVPEEPVAYVTIPSANETAE